VRLEPDDDFVPVGRLLEGVGGVQQAAFLEVVADQLQADRHAAFAEAAGTLMPGSPASSPAA
jgi:hypothetical protein